MGAGHTRLQGVAHQDSQTSRRTLLILVASVAVIAIGTAIGAALLWPRGPVPGDSAVAISDRYGAAITNVRTSTCEATRDDRSLDGSIPAQVTCGALQVKLTDGPDAGSMRAITVTSGVLQSGLKVGQRIRVEKLPPDAGLGPSAYIWGDYDRQMPLVALTITFVLLVVAVARLRGLVALAGLAVAFLMVVFFLLPALRRGENPALVAFVGSVAVMLVILYAAHGISAKTTTALLGTVAGLAATTGLAWWAAGAARLTGQTSSDSYVMVQMVGAETVAGVVTSGLVLAGLGVLNDVTVTQASAVWELHSAAPHLGPWSLFARGMRIGRDHLASTVYTIAFAYAAVSLSSLMFLSVYRTPWRVAASSGGVAQEIVGVLVGGIGLVLAIPLTTAIAALVVATTAMPSEEPRDTPPVAARREPGTISVSPDVGEQFVEGLLIRRRHARARERS